MSLRCLEGKVGLINIDKYYDLEDIHVFGLFVMKRMSTKGND